MNILILITALIQVESSGDDSAIGDGGSSWGCLQISAIMIQDVNRITGRAYTRADALDRGKSIEIALAYFKHYGSGRSIEDLSRMWNGGPDGWTQIEATDPHWKKVRAEIEILEQFQISEIMDLLYGKAGS